MTMIKAMAHSKSPPRRHHIGIFAPNMKHNLGRKHLSISDFKLPVIAERLQQYKRKDNQKNNQNAAGDDLEDVVAIGDVDGAQFSPLNNMEHQKRYNVDYFEVDTDFDEPVTQQDTTPKDHQNDGQQSQLNYAKNFLEASISLQQRHQTQDEENVLTLNRNSGQVQSTLNHSQRTSLQKIPGPLQAGSGSAD